MSVLIVFYVWIKHLCIGSYSGHFLPYWGMYFLNNIRKPWQIIYFLISLSKIYLIKQKWMFYDYFENFIISHFGPPWNKLISEQYNNLIHIYFFLCVIHKHYANDQTGQWYNYLVIYDVHKTSPQQWYISGIRLLWPVK